MKVRVLGVLGGVLVAGVLVSVAGAASRSAARPTIEWVRDFQGVTPVNIFARTAGGEIAIHEPLNQFGFLEGIAVTPDGRTAYVSSLPGSPSRRRVVTPVDLVTGVAEAQIKLPQPGFPSGVAVAPDGNMAYVVDAGNGGPPFSSIVPISVATNTVGTPIALPNLTGNLVISPDGHTLWAEQELGAFENQLWLTPIDLATDTPGSGFMIGFGNGEDADLAVTPNGQTLYATTGRFQLLRVDTETHAVTVIGLPHNSAFETMSYGVAVNPAGTEVLVGNWDSQAVVPVRVATNAVGTPIIVASVGTAETVAWGPAGKTAWVDGVAPITGRTVGARIPNAIGESIAMTPDQPPVAKFTTTQHRGQARFDAAASYPQSTAIATYAWNYGDGTSAVTTTPTTTHTYMTPGTYTVTLTLTDTAGTSTTQVYTGRSMLRNGSLIAQATHTVTIS
jgi:hypothetical protein